MRLSLLLSFFTCLAAWAGPGSLGFGVGEEARDEVTDLRKPITLQVMNYHGSIELVPGDSESTAIHVRASGLSLPPGERAFLDVDSPEADVVTIRVRYPVLTQKVEVVSIDFDEDGSIRRTTRTVESAPVSLKGGAINSANAKGAARLEVEIPPHFLGHTMIVTENARINAKGFAHSPYSNTRRVLWLVAPWSYQLGGIDFHFSEFWTQTALTRCSDLLLSSPANTDERDLDAYSPFPKSFYFF